MRYRKRDVLREKFFSAKFSEKSGRKRVVDSRGAEVGEAWCGNDARRHHNGPSDDPFVKVLRSLRRERRGVVMHAAH